MSNHISNRAGDRAPDFVSPDPFEVVDARLAILAHINQRNRFEKARQIAQNEREIAAELERLA